MIHPIRKALNISPTDYCVLDAVYRLSKNTKYGGWCVMSKKSMADDLCMSERAIFKILNVLESKELIEKNELGHLRTKDLWNELIANTHDYYIAFNGKESQFVSGRLPPQPQTAQIAEGYAQNAEGMNKVHDTYEQSSYPPMNKVHDTYEQSSYNNKKTIRIDNNIYNNPLYPPKGESVEFQNFWREYPKKKARTAALRAFQKIPKGEVEKIMSALAIQKKSEDWTKDGGRFIPYPASWLNGRRWEDDTAPPPEKKVSRYPVLTGTPDYLLPYKK